MTQNLSRGKQDAIVLVRQNRGLIGGRRRNLAADVNERAPDTKQPAWRPYAGAMPVVHVVALPALLLNDECSHHAMGGMGRHIAHQIG